MSRNYQQSDAFRRDEETDPAKLTRDDRARAKALAAAALPTITVTFHPQAWQNDYAIPVDPQGPTTWEVPVEKLRGIEQGTYDSDHLRLEDEAPEWCREWSGPFEITWDEDAVRP